MIRDLPTTAMPDFVTGFIFGLTNHNHTNISDCYQAPSPDLLSYEVQTGVNALNQGKELKHFVTAGAAFGMFIQSFESTLTTCDGLQDDLDWINKWSAILNDPETLGWTITENSVTYKASILVDRNFLLIDWYTDIDQHYYWAGVDVANLS